MPEVYVTDILLELQSAKEEIPNVVEKAIFDNADLILSMNAKQLYDGKDIFGKDIRPLYTEDPYFKTQAQALGYAKWKQQLTPNSNRNPYAPNLYINGYFYNSRTIEKKGFDIVISVNSSNQLSIKVDNKYHDILGLNDDNEQIINNEKLMPEIWELLSR